MKKKLFGLILTFVVLCGIYGKPVKNAQKLPRSEASLAMEQYLTSDPELMAMMEKSIKMAHEINPDPETNPSGKWPEN